MTAAVTGAPTVRARETRPPAFPAVVHTHTDTLRELQEGPLSAAALAQATDRDPSNMKRDLHKLRTAGVVDLHDSGIGNDKVGHRWALTDKGRQWIAGADVAEGLTPAPSRDCVGTDLSTLPIWPLDRIIPNAANRTVDLTTIPDMADSLINNGQLQPIVLTPVRDDGNRMLLIGERRWRGARLAAEEGRLPPALQAGLRFEEREATEAEAVGIMIVENVERQSIPPLELAFSLARFADLNGADGKPLSGRETAERLGLGQRDVLDKIRIARHATPDAISAYREHGSWDRLRESIPASRATPEKGEAVSSLYPPEAAPNLYQWEARGGKGLVPPELLRKEDPDRPNVGELIRPGQAIRTNYGSGPYRVEQVTPHVHGNHTHWSITGRALRADGTVETAPFSLNEVIVEWEGDAPRFRKLFKASDDEVLLIDAPDAASGARTPEIVTTAAQRLALAELWHKAGRLPGVDVAILPSGHTTEGARLAQYGLAWLKRGDTFDTARITQAGVDYLTAEGLTGNLQQAHHNLRFDLSTWTPGRYTTAWLNPPATIDAATIPARTPTPDAPAGIEPITFDAEAERSPTATFSARPRLALIEIAHKTAAQRLPIDSVHPAEWTGDPAQDFTAFGCTCGAHWLDAPVQAVIAEGLAHVVQIPGGHPALLTLTTAGVAWFDSQAIALPVRYSVLFEHQGALLPVGGSLYVTDSIGIEAKPSEEGSGNPVAADPAPVDLWDRDADQIAADDALLLRVMALINPDDHPGHGRPGDTAAGLMLELGVNPSAEVNDNGGVLLSTEHGPVELITIDARRTLPDARATALAWLVAWAVETALGVA